MSRYTVREYETGMIVIVREDGAVIPSNESNMDYLEYLEWCAAGNEPAVWDPEVK